MQAKDLTDGAVLQAVRDDAIARHAENIGACWWTVADNYFPAAPRKVVKAKLYQLTKKGLINGCHCGCRGDYTFTEKGQNLLDAYES